MPLFLPLICLAAMGVATLRRAGAIDPANPALRDDAPARLLGWAVSLLPASRAEWGQAMLGELACLQGRGRRWRFAAGCAGAVLLLPPQGRAAAAVMAAAAGTAVLYARIGIRYGLGGGDWAQAAVALALLAGYAVGVSVQLRRPGLALPGLAAGLLVAVAWAAPRGFTFYGLITAIPPRWAVLLQLIVVPMAIGAAGTLWGGSAAAGRRIARLAALTAGLGVFLYATLAVAAIGAAGAQIDATWTIRASIADRLGNNAVFYLWFLPLTTAALGWAAATATARLHPHLASVAPLPVPVAGPVNEGRPDPATAPPDASPAARSRNPNLLLWCALAVAIVLLVAVTLLTG